MDVVVNRIRCVDLQDQGTALLQANGQETGARDLDIDWDFWRAAELNHRLLLFGAYLAEELVGYVVGIHVPSHPQHKGWSIVNAEVLYVDPAHRRSAATSRLMAALSQSARALRAHSVLWGAKVGTGFEQVLDKRDSFIKFEVFYEEQL